MDDHASETTATLTVTQHIDTEDGSIKYGRTKPK